MPNRLIIARHGDRDRTTTEWSGDGPLTYSGQETVRASAQRLVDELQQAGVGQVDHAVVSGSIRCAQTFALLWDALLLRKIQVMKYDMDPRYYSTVIETEGWRALFSVEENRQAYLGDIETMGEKDATLKHAGDLVRACVERTCQTLLQIFRFGREPLTVMVVTHGPHDALIAEYFTGQVYPGLKTGHYRIIEPTRA